MERERQAGIWGQFRTDSNSVEFLDAEVDRTLGYVRAGEVKSNVLRELGGRYTAAYYERVYSNELYREVLGLGQTAVLNLAIISTGVQFFNGNNYHYLGFLREA